MISERTTVLAIGTVEGLLCYGVEMPTSLLWLARLLSGASRNRESLRFTSARSRRNLRGVTLDDCLVPLLQCTDVRYHSSRSAFGDLIEVRTCNLRHVHGAIAP